MHGVYDHLMRMGTVMQRRGEEDDEVDEDVDGGCEENDER